MIHMFEDKLLASWNQWSKAEYLYIDVNLLAIHAKRVTIQKKDVDIWKTLTMLFGSQ